MNSVLIIVGAGEHARVVAEAAALAGLDLGGYLDPNADSRGIQSLRRLGDDADAEELSAAGSQFIIGIGGLVATGLRREVASRYDEIGARWAIVVHPSATVSPDASIGEGAFLGAAAVVNGGATIGRHVIVNTGALVEHDVTIGDHAIIGPGVTIGGGTVVEAGAVIGLGASVRDHVIIGAESVVGMGSVVTRSIKRGATVMGVPARETKHDG